MFTRTALLAIGLGFVSFSVSPNAQAQKSPSSTRPSSAAAAAQEFPVVLRQNVVAGKTPVGTTVQAKLVTGTLVNGEVIPHGALLTGEVITSTAMTATTPSRLAIRMDSAQWKKGSASLKIYLTSWFYPSVLESGPDLRYGPDQTDKKSWSGMGEYPDHTPGYQPFPGSGSNPSTPVPSAPSPVMSRHRAPMADVETQRGDDGSVILVCGRANLKLDKLTTYVLAPGNFLPPSAK
ncbi:MAG TPA: hypothetical protein VMG31_09435 [Verrucomicrobiae bacterium]|nr:hypothetical protein [Verrucomicrobiae bacterium]